MRGLGGDLLKGLAKMAAAYALHLGFDERADFLPRYDGPLSGRGADGD